MARELSLCTRFLKGWSATKSAAPSDAYRVVRFITGNGRGWKVVRGVGNLDSPPSLISPPSVSGGPEVGSTLTASSGSWSGNPYPDLSYSWMRDGAAIDGETSSQYELTVEDVGSSLSVLVTASNELGSQSSQSQAIAIPPLPNGAMFLSETVNGIKYYITEIVDGSLTYVTEVP